jgi:hypothetical protein
MVFNYNKLKFIIALFVIFGLAVACGSKKDSTDKKEDTKKEETTKDETKKEETRKDETTTGSGNKLYFCEEYKNGKEIGVSDVFTIPSGGGYLTVMIKLDDPIGVGKVDLRISKKTGGTEKIVETIPFDVQPDWDYIHFDEVTFKSAGMHRVTLMKADGTPIASGDIQIKYR